MSAQVFPSPWRHDALAGDAAAERIRLECDRGFGLLARRGLGAAGFTGGGVWEGAPLWVALGARWVPRADLPLKIPPRVRRAALKECGQMETPWEMGWGLRGLAGGETDVGTSGEQWPFARSVLGRRNKS